MEADVAKADPFLNSLRPFIWMEKFYGALPFQIHSSEVKISKSIIIWGILFNIFYLYHIVIQLVSDADLHLSFLESTKYKQFEEVISYLTDSEFLLTLILAAGTYVSYISRITHIRKFYEKILKYRDYIDDNDYRKKTFWLMISEIMFFFILNWTCLLLFEISDIFESESWWKRLLRYKSFLNDPKHKKKKLRKNRMIRNF